MARIITQAQYDARIAKQQTKVDKAKKKLDDLEPKYQELKDAYQNELTVLEGIKAEKQAALNDIVISYMMNHKHKDSDETYFDSFMATIEEQYGKGFFSKTVIDMEQEKANRAKSGMAPKAKAKTTDE